jgi:hypothetical protein
VPVNRQRVPRSILARRLLKVRKGLICEECGCGDSKGNMIQAHHIERAIYCKTKKGNYYQDPRSNHSESNGRLLCKNCHKKIHFPNKT